jgi:hypothetical protein
VKKIRFLKTKRQLEPYICRIQIKIFKNLNSIMNKKKLIGFLTGGFAIALIAVVAIAADHMDAESVDGTSSDIADFYAFESMENSTKSVFVATFPIAAGTSSDDASFDENVLLEFNIDNSGDLVEDLVIQAIPRNGKMYFSNPYLPSETGTSGTIDASEMVYSVDISSSTTENVEEDNGLKFYAGPRRDYFYFDFDQFNTVVSGGDADGFSQEDDASDFFADLDVMTVVVEVPNSMLGVAPTHIVTSALGVEGFDDAYNVWATTNRQQ